MDELKFDFSPPLAAQQAAALGRGTVRDNHGNSVSGRQLTCADGRSEHLSLTGWTTLNTDLATYLIALGSGSREVDLRGADSPLEVFCRSPRPVQAPQRDRNR